MTTTLQYHDHAIERCDATTGHAVVTVALCRDTATARMLVDAYNSQEIAKNRDQVLREVVADARCRVVELLNNSVVKHLPNADVRQTIANIDAALAATEVQS